MRFFFFRIAGDIVTNGPLAVRAAKMAIDRGLDTHDMSNALEIEKECYASILPSYDRLEGLDAFHNMRQPVYLGK
jgi:methylglutaconyl-CoA hydratase